MGVSSGQQTDCVVSAVAPQQARQEAARQRACAARCPRKRKAPRRSADGRRAQIKLKFVIHALEAGDAARCAPQLRLSLFAWCQQLWRPSACPAAHRRRLAAARARAGRKTPPTALGRRLRRVLPRFPVPEGWL